MDILSQKNKLKKLVVVLALFNLLWLVYFGWKIFLHKQQRNTEVPVPQTELSQALKDELGLSEQQADSLRTIRASFFVKEKKLSEETRLKRDSMNKLMFSENVNDSLLKQLAADISANEYQMELLRIEQAAKLRTLCKPEQLKKLNSLIKEVRDYLKPAPDKK